MATTPNAEFECANEITPFENDVTVSMGEWSNNGGAPEEGIYYLTTKDESPYSCEEEECFID